MCSIVPSAKAGGHSAVGGPAFGLRASCCTWALHGRLPAVPRVRAAARERARGVAGGSPRSSSSGGPCDLVLCTFQVARPTPSARARPGSPEQGGESTAGGFRPIRSATDPAGAKPSAGRREAPHPTALRESVHRRRPPTRRYRTSRLRVGFHPAPGLTSERDRVRLRTGPRRRAHPRGFVRYPGDSGVDGVFFFGYTMGP